MSMPLDFDRERKSNDEFRVTRVNVYDDVLWPKSIVSRGREFKESVLKAIREQHDFTHDEFGLHDHGAVVVDGLTLHWSIENRSATGITADPDRATDRAITIGESSDYFKP